MLLEAWMELKVLKAKKRPLIGKGAARKIRALGYVPAIVYGKGLDPIPVVVDPKQVAGIIASFGKNALVRLELLGEEKSYLCLIRDYSVHPFKRTLEHCDLMKVEEDSLVVVDLPIKIVGKSEGEKAGGKLSVPLKSVKAKCRAAKIPNAIEVDVSPLKIGETLMLSQLKVPEGTTLVFSKDSPVAIVRMGKAEKAQPEGTSAAKQQ
jgi:large subunit ribosomal protein L25